MMATAPASVGLRPSLGQRLKLALARACHRPFSLSPRLLISLPALLLLGCQTYERPTDIALVPTPIERGEIVASDATTLTRTEDGWRIRFPAQAGHFYQVETSTDLETWRVLSAPLPADGNPLATALQARFPMSATVLDPAGRMSNAFFRVREVENPYR